MKTAFNLLLFGGRGASSASGGGGASGALQEEALEWYASGDGMWINQALRGNGEISMSDLNDNEKKLLKGLDEATNASLGKEITLYRSVDAAAVFGNISEMDYYNLQGALCYGDKSKIAQAAVQKFVPKAEGKTITEKGFMSTSKDRTVAEEWGGFSGSSKPIVVEVKTKKTTKGKDMKAYDVSGNEQKEVLLKRNQQWKTKRIYGRNGNIVVEGEFV